MSDPLTKPSKNNLFLVGLILSMFCWGLTWTSGKILSSYGSAVSITFIRFIVTFISLFILLLFSKEKLTIQKNGFLDLLISSVLIAFYYYFFFKGLEAGKAGAGGVLVTTLNPIISYAIGMVIKRQAPSTKVLSGLIIGIIAGCILLEVWNDLYKVFDNGNKHFLLASLSWAILSVFTARSSKYGSPVSFSLWMYGICCILLGMVVEKNEVLSMIKNTDFVFWSNLIFIATITTSIATTFYFVATVRLGASKASSFIFLVPSSAALGSWFFLGEILTLPTIIGGILGIMAVYIINSKNK